MAVPPSLKKYVPFVKRAEELEKAADRDARVVAYHCRLYVVVRGSKEEGASEPAVQGFLLSQMDVLEKMKPSLGLGDSASSFEVCKNYAMKMFTQADEEDRMGVADKATVKLFYYAGSFFDILEQFQSADLTDINEKKLYAKYRAAEILNAVKNGVAPSPPTGEAASSGMSMEEPDEASLQQMNAPAAPHQPYTHTPPASSSAPQAPAASVTFNTPAAPAAPVFHNYGAPLASKAPPTSSLDPRAKDCIELCHFAASALKFNDMNLARERLREALRKLE